MIKRDKEKFKTKSVMFESIKILREWTYEGDKGGSSGLRKRRSTGMVSTPVNANSRETLEGDKYGSVLVCSRGILPPQSPARSVVQGVRVEVGRTIAESISAIAKAVSAIAEAVSAIAKAVSTIPAAAASEVQAFLV